MTKLNRGISPCPGVNAIFIRAGSADPSILFHRIKTWRIVRFSVPSAFSDLPLMSHSNALFNRRESSLDFQSAVLITLPHRKKNLYFQTNSRWQRIPMLLTKKSETWVSCPNNDFRMEISYLNLRLLIETW